MHSPSNKMTILGPSWYSQNNTTKSHEQKLESYLFVCCIDKMPYNKNTSVFVNFMYNFSTFQCLPLLQIFFLLLEYVLGCFTALLLIGNAFSDLFSIICWVSNLVLSSSKDLSSILFFGGGGAILHSIA